ncbi:MAG TPA: hypothetical protein VFT98_15515 [Myxococcota bacterium]|nr:hypothetical protein [Myxococcota bacterium]
MRRLALFALVSGFLAFSASAALADQFVGQITKLDRWSKSVEVKGGDPQRKLRFFLGNNGEVTRAGAPVSFGELKRGDRVEIEFAKRGSTPVAHTIAIVPAGAAEAIGMRE